MGKYININKKMQVVRVEPELSSNERYGLEHSAEGDKETLKAFLHLAENEMGDILQITSFDDFLRALISIRDANIEAGWDKTTVETIMCDRVLYHAEKVMDTPGIHLAPETNAVAVLIDLTHHYFENEGISTHIAFWDTIEILLKRQYDHRLQGYTLPLTYAETILHGMGVFWDSEEFRFEDHIDELIHSICITECFGFEEFMAEPDIDDKGRYSIVMYRNDKTFDDRTPHETMIRKFAECCFLPFVLEYNGGEPDELLTWYEREWFKLQAEKYPDIEEIDEDELMTTEELHTFLIENFADVLLATYTDKWPWVSGLSVCSEEEYNLTRSVIASMIDVMINNADVKH